MRWLSEDSKLLPELVDQEIVSQKPSSAILCNKRRQKTLVSEIVRPSPEAAEPLNVSAPLAAAATRVRVDPSGDVVMTPVDQTQQSEDANFRKVVAQLHVNLGHPSNDALARAIRLFWRI